MALFRRREVPPAHVVALLPPEDRVLSWADVDGGGVVLASSRGVWWPSDGGHRLIGWQYIDKAVWRDGVLVVVEADVVDEVLLVDRPPVSVRLAVPRDLPPTIRKRVEANVVQSDVLPVTGGSARFVARRVPGQDGVAWWVRLEPGTQDNADVRASIESIITALRARWAVDL
jgi:hypothetical protein